jgi:arabinofuranosyltransferase
MTQAFDRLRRSPVHLAWGALLVAPVVVFLGIGYAHRWMADDGFIYLRVVDQLLAGNGPVFNDGFRVEAYTSPGWLALLAAGDVVLPIRLEWISMLLGLACSAVGMVAAIAGSRRLMLDTAATDTTTPRLRGVVVPAGILVFIAPFGMWLWQTSGLETPLTWAWLGASLFVLARWASDERRVGAPGAVLLGLGWLVRPELVLFSTLFLLVVLAGEWSSTTWRARAGTVAWFVALPVAYQVFRMGYFGLLVSNTAVAKEGTSVLWRRGLHYLEDFADPYWLWLPVAVVLLAGYLPLLARARRRPRLVVGAFLLGASVSALGVVANGGDYFHGRFFAPALFALCAPVAVVTLERRFLGMAAVVPWALVTLVAIRPPQLEGGLLSGFTVVPTHYGQVTLDDFGWGDGGPRLAWYDGEDLYVETRAFAFGFEPVDFEVAEDLPTPAVLVGAIGAVSYALGSEVHVVDKLGLAHPMGSHYEVTPDQDSAAGHDKAAPVPWLLAELAAPGDPVRAEALGQVSSPLLAAAAARELRQQVRDARHVMRCDQVDELWDAAAGHLGPRRFLRNFLHAPANTFLRIPPDPAEARRALC